MKLTYDKKVDAMNITFCEGKVAKSLEISPEVILDVDKNGTPLYLEIIGFKEKNMIKKPEIIFVGNKSFNLASV